MDIKMNIKKGDTVELYRVVYLKDVEPVVMVVGPYTFVATEKAIKTTGMENTSRGNIQLKIKDVNDGVVTSANGVYSLYVTDEDLDKAIEFANSESIRICESEIARCNAYIQKCQEKIDVAKSQGLKVERFDPFS